MKALVLAVLVFAQAACDRGSHVSASATSGPTIKLVEAGSGPKKVLRFTAQKGLKKTLTMTMDMGMTMNIGGTPRTQPIPTISMGLELEVTDVDKNGDLRYDFKLTQPEVITNDPDDPAASAVRQALEGMTGLSGSAIVTDRGFTKHVDIDVPAGANPQIAQFVDSLKQSIGQMSAPLPEEPVGVGAKWETTMKIEQSGGLKLQQVATNELVSLEGNAITFNIVVKQTAAPQKITKNGVTIDLQSYEGSGSGQTSIDVTQLVPSKGNLAMKSDMKMKAGEQQMSMGIDLKMTFTSR